MWYRPSSPRTGSVHDVSMPARPLVRLSVEFCLSAQACADNPNSTSEIGSRPSTVSCPTKGSR